MKLLLAALIFACALPARAAYLKTFFQDPAHPKVSGSMLLTSRGDFDGGESDLALIFHKADPAETLMPQALLDLGIKPVSWTLLEGGAGGNTHTGFLSAGPGVYVAPTLLGPLTQALEAAGGNYAVLGHLLVSPDGSGLRLGVHWKANVINNGGLTRFNDLRFPPRYVFGYGYQF